MKKFSIVLWCLLLCGVAQVDLFAYQYDDDDDYPYYSDDFSYNKYRVSERLEDVYAHASVKEEAIKLVDMIKNSGMYEGLGAKIHNVITINGGSKSERKLLAYAITGDADAFLIEVKSLPSMSVCKKLAKNGPLVVFGENYYNYELKEFLEKVEKHKPKKDRYPIVLIRTQNYEDNYWWDSYDEVELEGKIKEKVIKLSILDEDAREGLLKKFCADIRVKPDVLCSDYLKKLAENTNKFGTKDLHDLVDMAAVLAAQDYSLHGNPDYFVAEEHFDKAYTELSKKTQKGQGGGSWYVKDFDYTYSEKTKFSDVLGLDHVLVEVKEYVDILLNPEKYTEIGVRPPKGLLLEGLPGVGKTLIARAVAGESGCCFISICAARFINGFLGGGAETIDALFDFANQIAPDKPKIIFIDEFDSLGKRSEDSGAISNEFSNTINKFLERMDGFSSNEKILVIAATNNAEKLDSAVVRPGRFDRKIYVPLPDKGGLVDICLHYMKNVACEKSLCNPSERKIFVEGLAKKCKGFNGAGLRTLVNEAAILAVRADSDVVKREHFWEAFNKIAPGIQSALGGDNDEGFHYTFSESTRYTDVIGMKEVKENVAEFVDALINPQNYIDMGVKRQKGMIFYGPPGTGKTLLARAIAGEAGCCFISANASSFAKVYVGAGPAKVRKLFRFARKMAQNKQVIIFFDEIDAFGNRKGSFDNSERKNIINALLTEIDGFAQDQKIAIIGATNHFSLIDGALLRDGRFDKKLEIPVPCLEDREAILEHYLKKIKLDPQISLVEIAHNYAKEFRGLTGATLEGFVKQAGLRAVHNGDQFITLEHLEEALLDSTLGLKVHTKQTQEELEKTAYHEAGHALLTVLTGNEISRVSIMPRTKALGVVFKKDKHEIFSNNGKIDLMHDIVIALGGFCAENYIYNQPTPGALSDINYVNDLAFQMVHKYGMGDGPLKGLTSTHALSDKMKEKFDDATLRLVQKCMNVAELLCKKYDKELHDLGKKLLELESLTAEQVYQIVGQPQDVATGLLG